MSEATTEPKIWAITIRDFKGIELAELRIDPTDPLILIHGRNGAGKSSAIDAFVSSIAGTSGKRFPAEAVRHGAKAMETIVNLGAWIVRQSKTATGERRLEVTCTDKSKLASSPQAHLDQFFDDLSLDPFFFMKQNARDQNAIFLKRYPLGFDLDGINKQRDEITEWRLETGRELKAQQGVMTRFEGLPAECPQPIDVSALSEERSKLLQAADNARRDAAEHERAWKAHEAAVALIDNIKAQIVALQDQEEIARKQLAAAEADVAITKKQCDASAAAVDAKPEERIEEIDAAIKNAQNRYAEISLWNERVKAAEKLADAETMYADYTRDLKALETRKAEGMAAMKMPLPGLSFSEEGLRYEGCLLSECCTSLQIRVGMAIAMQRESQVPFCVIRDGNDLDRDSLNVIRDMALQHGFQILIERVISDVDEFARSGQPGFVIDEGKLVDLDALRARLGVAA
jgi:hypothetical protein